MHPTFIVQLILSVIIGFFCNPLVEYIKDGSVNGTGLTVIIVLALSIGKFIGEISPAFDKKESDGKALK